MIKRRIICCALALVMIMTLASCADGTDGQDTATADEIEVTEYAEKSEEPVTEFDFVNYIGVVVSDDIVLYNSDVGLYRLDDTNHWEQLSDVHINRVQISGDTIYYVAQTDTENEDNYELCSMKADGTDLETLCRINGISSPDILMQRGDKIYFTGSFEGINEYDTKTGTIKVVYEGYVGDARAADGKIYFTSSEDLSSDSRLYRYDPASEKVTEVYDDEFGHCDLIRSGDDLYFIPAKDYSETKQSTIFRINTDSDRAEKVQDVSVDGTLDIVAVKNDTVFYQNYSENDGRFQTFSVKLGGGDEKRYENIDYKLNNDSYLDTVAVFEVDFDTQKFVIYDFEQSAFKGVDNKDGVNVIFLAPGSKTEYRGYKRSAEVELPEIVNLTISDDLPTLDDLYCQVESSPDNEYVRLKRTYVSYNGGIYKIPELTMSGEDIQEINDELNQIPDSGFGQYYRTELNDHYLTFYTVLRGDGSNRYYSMYTVDINTGKQLDNDDIVALVAGDRDSFYARLKEELIQKQKDIYLGYGTKVENEVEQVESNGRDEEVPEDVLEYPVSEDAMSRIVLGYLGGGRIYCVAGFRNFAGGYAGSHLFEFDYWS